MKTKPIFTALLFASAMAFTSCSSDDTTQVINPEGQEGTITFTAALPSVAPASRAYADGLSATNLYYAVYDSSNKLIITNYSADGVAAANIKEDKVTFSDRQAKVSFSLALGKTYEFLFWAQADDAPYTFDPTDGTITVDYEKQNSNDENYDAFFKKEEITFNQASVNKTITLTRPFAQLNIGAIDITAASAAGLSISDSEVTVAGAYTKLNLFDGEVSEPQTITYALSSTPAKQNETLSISGVEGSIEYLSMNYVLVGKDQATFDSVTLDYKNGDDATLGDDVKVFYNVPLQRNHRTNIYGNLLTSTQEWTIIIDQNFDESDIDVDASK